MSKIFDPYEFLYRKEVDPKTFNYDLMTVNPLWYYLSDFDIEYLRGICTSIKLMSKIDEKYKLISNVMHYRGFVRLAGGTNRVVYRHLEDQRIIVKIAVDKIGQEANFNEFQNQAFLKPFCSKTYTSTACGTVALAERVTPLINKAEFNRFSNLIYCAIIDGIIGCGFIADDIGSDYFMNWAYRPGFGPVIIDYPYIYEIDGDKLFCTKEIGYKRICGGQLDYDQGFNKIICTKCGKRYFAKDLALNKDGRINYINTRRRKPMKVSIMRGNQVICSSVPSADVMELRNKREPRRTASGVKIMRGRTVICDSNIAVKREQAREMYEKMKLSEEDFDKIAKESFESILSKDPPPIEEEASVEESFSQDSEDNEEEVTSSAEEKSIEEEPVEKVEAEIVTENVDKEAPQTVQNYQSKRKFRSKKKKITTNFTDVSNRDRDEAGRFLPMDKTTYSSPVLKESKQE